jgi:hypothetical protein
VETPKTQNNMAAQSQENSHLCDQCADIDFKTYFMGEVHRSENLEVIQESKDARHLGLRLEIRQRVAYCAFCALVDETLTRSYRYEDEDATCWMMSYCCGYNKEGKAYQIRIIGYGKNEGIHFSGDIQLLSDDAIHLGLLPQFHGRLIPETGFDVGTALKWLDICLYRHGALCTTPGFLPEENVQPPEPTKLYAIDLEDMCICEMPHGSRYIALSYCWPATPYLTLQRANLSDLFTRNSITRAMDQFPMTVQDAILCSSELKFRYLWIDACCIIQDDNEHKIQQLQQMDRVYGAATLTLVCAYPVAHNRADSCSGFPGYRVTGGSRKQFTRTVKDLRMLVPTRGIEATINQTRWDKRCWTFQENHLSRRLLYFTHQQVYFQCSCSVFCENTVGEDVHQDAFLSQGAVLWNPKNQYNSDRYNDDYGFLRLNRVRIFAIAAGMSTFTSAVMQYASRDISFASDYLNAFEGVAAILRISLNTELWQGVPENFFDRALCWTLWGKFRRTRLYDSLNRRPIGDPLFPSWSWAGWYSSINYLFTQWVSHRSEVDWFIINQEETKATKLRITRNNVRIIYTPDGNKDLSPPLVNIEEFLPSVVPRLSIDSMSEEWRLARLVACWTTSADFLIDGSEYPHPSLQMTISRRWVRQLTIKDASGSVAGCITMPVDFAEDHLEDPQMYKFMMITRVLLGKGERLPYFDKKIYPYRDWCMLHVMLTRGTTRGIVQRMGIGIVHEDAWIKACPVGVFLKME